ncbi:hypothetical protein AVEN_218468-1 [Araneus ventricosus]|uniref:Uncharacterized protein n=1 Tax=Araneus ventricosus TaxID=182803 RepID=A0A4Y2TDX6_ARAVE|nr:hypothetical protein AVEN_250282-1 [Araneus ventricosus]GBN98848.1 hypothetical protein AVEN_218468-1 [Araneus ventricosus]
MNNLISIPRSSQSFSIDHMEASMAIQREPIPSFHLLSIISGRANVWSGRGSEEERVGRLARNPARPDHHPDHALHGGGGYSRRQNSDHGRRGGAVLRVAHVPQAEIRHWISFTRSERREIQNLIQTYIHDDKTVCQISSI